MLEGHGDSYDYVKMYVDGITKKEHAASKNTCRQLVQYYTMTDSSFVQFDNNEHK